MTEPGCCRRCRLIQPISNRMCVQCASANTVRLHHEWGWLLEQRTGGVRPAQLQPKPGLGDRLRLAFVGSATVGTIIAGVVFAGPSGILLGPVTALAGYAGQFVHIIRKRRHVLGTVPPPGPPVASSITGTARSFEPLVGRRNGGRPVRLVTTTTLWGVDGIYFRTLHAVPFWLVDDGGERTLVTGWSWIAERTPAIRTPTDPALLEATRAWLSIPLELSLPSAILSHRTIADGDRVRVIGQIQREHMPELATYRDAAARVLRGAPGVVPWIIPEGTTS